MAGDYRSRYKLLSVVFLLSSGVGFSATMSQTATCNTWWQYQTNITADVGSTSCAAQLSNATTSASSSTALEISGNTLSFTTSGASSAPDMGMSLALGPYRSTASASYSFTTTLVTSGSGLGYVEVSESGGQGSAGDGVSGVDFAGLPGLQNCVRGSNCLLLPTFYQIELGTPITINITGFTSADNGDNHGLSEFEAQFTANFFAADGTTPVNVSEVPEPSALYLLASGLIIGALVAVWRTGRSQA